MMKTKGTMLAACLGLVFVLGLPAVSGAQVYSQNIVGYINLLLQPGNNLIANQLDNNPDNTLDTIFSGNVPEGATFTEWNASLAEYMPLSTYDTNTKWSINYDLTYGQGGLLNTPSAFQNLFIGSVWPGFTGGTTYNNPPLISDTGLVLLSCYVPLDNATFYDIVGRDPLDGEYVQILNPLTQTVSTTTFNDCTWDNGAPLLAVGQSAFFGLGGTDSTVLAAPEPSTCGLFGAGLLALAACRHRRRDR